MSQMREPTQSELGSEILDGVDTNESRQYTGRALGISIEEEHEMQR